MSAIIAKKICLLCEQGVIAMTIGEVFNFVGFFNFDNYRLTSDYFKSSKVRINSKVQIILMNTNYDKLT